MKTAILAQQAELTLKRAAALAEHEDVDPRIVAAIRQAIRELRGLELQLATPEDRP